ncbi:MAG: long-chain acyl-CoA synthetase, partial [Frankiaceae bacterium]|nr:long-chain acyl-CoA synthetase [Frankiaceae bacterium]
MSAEQSVAEPRNLAELVSRAAARHPDKAALVAGGRTVSWGELDALVSALASSLVARGLPAGSRVGLLLPNSIEFAVAYFGVLRAGLVALPLNTAYTATELGYQLSDSGASLVFASGPFAELVSSVEVVVTGSEAWESLLASSSGGAASGGAARAGAEDTAVLLYTSGTSGRPKGAMLTHRALLANLAQLSR